MLAPKFPDFGRPKQRSWRTSTIVLNGLLALFAGLAFYRYLHPGGFGFVRLRCVSPASHPEKPPPMDVFQVYPPVRVGQDYLPALESPQPECSVVLMQHVFGWSYGKPFVGKLRLDRDSDGALTRTRDLCSPRMQVDTRALQPDHDLYRPPV